MVKDINIRKKSRNVFPSLYSHLIEVVYLEQILCHRTVEPHGLSVNFFGDETEPFCST